MLKFTWDQIIHEPGTLFTIMVAFAIGFVASRKGNPAMKIGLLALAVMYLFFRESTLLGRCWMWAVISGFLTQLLGLHYGLLGIASRIRERLRASAMGGSVSREQQEVTEEHRDDTRQQNGSSGRDTAYQHSQEEFARRQQQRQSNTAQRAKEKAAQAKRERASRSKAEEEAEEFFREQRRAKSKKRSSAKQEQKSSPPPPEDPPKPPPERREWWEVLGVSPSATLAEIKKARNAKAMQFHSDKIQHMSETFKLEAEEELKAINGAFETAKKRRK